MKCFIGLGNPGQKYIRNRHNVGFMVIDHFSQHLVIQKAKEKNKAWIQEASYEQTKILLVKPLTYMNLSGEAVRQVMSDYSLNIEDIVIIYDDLDTHLGKLRLRFQGSAGGHNGMKSIIAHTHTQLIKRIRIGISRPAYPMDIAQYVLSDFAKTELSVLMTVLDRTQEAMKHSLFHSFEDTMNLYNTQN